MNKKSSPASVPAVADAPRCRRCGHRDNQHRGPDGECGTSIAGIDPPIDPTKPDFLNFNDDVKAAMRISAESAMEEKDRLRPF